MGAGKQSNFSVSKISIDEKGDLKRLLDQTEDNNGVSKYHMDINGIRAKLRDSKYRNDKKFIGNQVGKGVLGEGINDAVPRYPIVKRTKLKVK